MNALKNIPRVDSQTIWLERESIPRLSVLEIHKSIYGLPQADLHANQQLREHLKPAGFHEVAHTPGLWQHKRQLIQSSLIVDDFGVKYVTKEHCDLFLKELKKYDAKVTED